jgi:hypothetical protein
MLTTVIGDDGRLRAMRNPGIRTLERESTCN